MKRFLLFALTFVASVQLWAQAPKGYYDQANGKKKEALKAAMKDIIGKANVLGYGSGAGKTWEGFYETDRYDGNKCRDRYSNGTFYFTNKGAVPAGLNIEHSFPKSWWGGTQNQAYKDLFNLMPSESKINSSKGNFAMGVVTSATTDNGCTKVGKGKAGNKDASLWEPADKWKGDFARSYMYMATSYSNLTFSGEGLTMLENNNWPTLQKWAYELLVKWNRQDPVDQIERDRNEAVYKIQGNRNPFVDFPNLCEYIWGDSIDYAFSVDGTQTGGGDDDDKPIVNPDELIAYEATEIVCSPYSKRFDANWSRYKDGCTYTLDVYTKDGTKETSLEGFPVTTTNTTHRVTGVEASTTYYYTVYVYEDGKMVTASNEVRVDMPKVQPVFSVDKQVLTFSAVPGQPSEAQKLGVTMIAVDTYEAGAYCSGPFELSLDGETWNNELAIKGSSNAIYVRLAAMEEEGTYSDVLRLVHSQVGELEVLLQGKVNAQMAFLETFETGSKGAYSAGTVKCAATTWQMTNAMIGTDTRDKRNDAKSARIKGGGFIEMTEDKLMGCDSLWIFAGPYGTDSDMAMTINYSTDEGATWTNVVDQLDVDGWGCYSFYIGKQGGIRLKITSVGGTSSRINVDDIQMNDYKSSTAIDGLESEKTVRKEDVYDLLGRKMRQPSGRGIYIVGGKKIVR